MKPSTLSLTSSRLSIQLALPGVHYRTSRFDWTTGVYSILLDGRHQFASSEVQDPELLPFRGQGLACEFGIRIPLGYEDCPVGDYFPKLGVGLIKREDLGEYNFFHHYLDFVGADFTWKRLTEASVSLESYGAVHRGWGWKLTRTWEVQDNHLILSTEVENLGQKTIKTNEYCHNFLRMGEKLAGAGTSLELGHPATFPEVLVDLEDLLRLFNGEKGTTPGSYAAAEFTKTPQGEFYIGNFCGTGVLENAWWRLVDKNSGLSAEETLDGCCSHIDFWGKATVLSPELFKLVHVEPGEKQTWSRTWTFNTL